MQYRLSKSKFLSAFQCRKRLWLEIHDKDKATPIDKVQEAIFNQGHFVGDLAMDRYPNGIEITSDYLDIPKGITITKEVLEKNPPSIFEGFFQYNNVLVRPDIMVNNNDGSWDFIEVKSSTKLKEENIRDVAIQTYVLIGSGIKIHRSYLMHINRECQFPDLDNLFELEDLTDEIIPLISEMDNSLINLRLMLEEKKEPDISIGTHCTSPYNCSFKEYCWKDVPEYSVFSIPGMYLSKKEELYKKDLISIQDVGQNFDLKNRQKDFFDSYVRKKPIINKKAITEELDNLKYPLYFLDFETFAPAVPQFDGLHPYEQYPFQYSCHIMDKNSNIIHKEYLHRDTHDPRLPLTKSLIKTLGEEGTIIAFNAAFEKGVINNLAKQFPKYENQLLNINKRFWDQLIIFRKYYMDYRFKGSNSLKAVLPIIVSGMDYSHLDVSDGSKAQVAWADMITLSNSLEKEKLISQLIEYCKLDTLAMVEIHKELIKIK